LYTHWQCQRETAGILQLHRFDISIMTYRTTRLAPSPTGTLHLGNLRTFLVNWALARQNGWKIVMRIEDLDAARVRPDSDKAILNALAWVGIDFDEGPYWQSHDLLPYRAAMRTLTDSRRAYACHLTRKEILAATSAPHGPGAEARFPAHLRSTRDTDYGFVREDANYRFVGGGESVTIEDAFAGTRTFHPSAEVGDFVIWTKTGVPAYQLAVVVDDARQGVTEVVRGDDLLASAARQTLLYRALDLQPPHWWHLPLVLGHDGRRLAKRHGDTHLETYRSAGVKPQRIIGLLAFWCNILDKPQEMSIQDFLHAFRIDTLPRKPVTFTQENHAWLELR
jgi:glutamyl-tRNA synthetase